MATFGLAFFAGILSVLSPCVMPLLPLVLGAAASEHKLGPAALAAGLAISFVAIGLFVATIGFSIGLDGDVFRRAAAVLAHPRRDRPDGAGHAGAARHRRRADEQLDGAAFRRLLDRGA